MDRIYYVSIIGAKGNHAITTFYGLSWNEAVRLCKNLNRKRNDLCGGVAKVFCEDSSSEYYGGVEL